MAKVFGIGLLRTGTTSLDHALRRLGYRSLHFPRPPTRENVLRLAAEYDALTDIPVILVYKRLARDYPDARFVLTVRDERAWIASCRAHCTLTWRSKSALEGRAELRRRVLGCTEFDAAAFRAARAAHHADVERFFAAAPERLLVMDVAAGDGYDVLCPFLGRAAPDEPFPTENGLTGRRRVRALGTRLFRAAKARTAR